ncbi:hypothetical protein G9444_3218 [Rhodococcus erythropolis]|uniref:Uncharacterized protein n=1 Tax=Rhodococcus erythropolis TaxID=1833 RepID=A0A6G9CTU5_RHOER|nr:hypothetical protein G9444_3218 [Rhodococcus erythropolis]
MLGRDRVEATGPRNSVRWNRLEVRSTEMFDDLSNALHRRVGDFLVVYRGFGCPVPEFERPPRPHRPGIEFLSGLQCRDTPDRFAIRYRPVQRRRPAISGRAGMDDDRCPPLPNRFRDIGFQERADDEVKISRRSRGQHCVRVGDDGCTDLVSRLAKNKTGPLRETVVGGDEKKHAQRWREGRTWA